VLLRVECSTQTKSCRTNACDETIVGGDGHIEIPTRRTDGSPYIVYIKTKQMFVGALDDLDRVTKYRSRSDQHIGARQFNV